MSHYDLIEDGIEYIDGVGYMLDGIYLGPTVGDAIDTLRGE